MIPEISPMQPLFNEIEPRPQQNPYIFDENSLNQIQLSKYPKILPDSAQCVSLCESLKNEDSLRSSK